MKRKRGKRGRVHVDEGFREADPVFKDEVDREREKTVCLNCGCKYKDEDAIIVEVAGSYVKACPKCGATNIGRVVK